MVYGCDAAWWRHRKGLPEFNGLKVCFSNNGMAEFPDIRRATIKKTNRTTYDEDILTETIGVIGSGGNSGFQALNLAVQFGAKRVLLIGFDMTDNAGVHWYGRNNWLNANNPAYSNFQRWLRAFEKAKPVLQSLGVEVISASQSPAFKVFPRHSVEDTIALWQ